jgi:DNA-binding response OmpR family regulator
MRVLIVEDYAPLARAIGTGLAEAGYAVDVVADGQAGLDYAQAAPYDAIVLDLMLPKLDGLSVLERLRRARHPAAVLILTARDGVPDRVKGLDLGADDYLVKPFAFEELLARLRALVRRRYEGRGPVVEVGDLEIDTVARAVRRRGRAVELSAREYALLEYLARRSGHVVTRAEIWDHVYDFAGDPSSNVVDVYIGYLRRKIDQDEDVKLIHTHRGQGYRLGVGEP